MTRVAASLTALVVLLAAGGAEARCFADYKAKRDAPLRLHYGVIEIEADPCEPTPEVEAEVAQRIAAEDWTLLQVLGTFGDDEVDDRRDDAGDYFLRY